MKNVKKITITILAVSCMLGIPNLISDASNSKSSIIISNNRSDVSNIDNNDNKLNVNDFKKEDNLPEKDYNSENWADDLYTADDLLGGKSDVTIDEFENEVLTKMLEVVSFMQSIAKPFCIILFILCAIGILMSIVFDTNKQKTFILGLILSVITYVGIIFAPSIVLFLANWLSF